MIDASSPPLRALLAGAIDYAGLFPPAALPMDQAAANYEAYRISARAWALGRFVAPAGRLAELAGVLDELGPEGDPWRVSATLGADWGADAAAIAAFNGRADARVDAVEGRVADPEAVGRLAARFGGGLARYGEVPLADDTGPVLDALARRGIAAKVRMGGVTPDAFPPAAAVATFLAGAAARALPFKATAGLHHACRGTYRLTYQPDSPVAPMYGYLDLALAWAAAQAGAGVEELERMLLDDGPGDLRVSTDGVVWRGRRVGLDAIGRLRTAFHGFGSCSFSEPMDEAAALGSA